MDDIDIWRASLSNSIASGTANYRGSWRSEGTSFMALKASGSCGRDPLGLGDEGFDVAGVEVGQVSSRRQQPWTTRGPGHSLEQLSIPVDQQNLAGCLLRRRFVRALSLLRG